jgi:protein-disulfide isomerase
MKTRFRLLPAALLPLAILFPAAAQQSPSPQSEGITRKQADDILSELRQIRQLLQQLNTKNAPQEPPAQKAKLALDGVPMLGAKTAPVTIVEFTDYQCPYCRSFHVSTFPELKKNYIDTGKVRFFSKDMPLDFHADAMRAAQAARCANDQGKFWQLRDVMGSNPNNLDLEHILGFAGDLKMDKDALRACIQSEKYKSAVQSDVMEAMKSGAGGTPTFVVGATTTEGVDGELVVGAQPFPVFDEKLKSLAK